MELTYVPATIAIISLLINLFLLWDRRKLKGFDIDKKLKLLDIQIEETKAKYNQKKLETRDALAQRGILGGGSSSISSDGARDSITPGEERSSSVSTVLSPETIFC